jgi:anti-anti-sigma regulatory factor
MHSPRRESETDLLKITNSGTATEQKWTLCGQLAGPWVAELESNWNEARDEPDGRKYLVDLTDVTFIDERGAQLLQQMRDEGAVFTARGVDTRDVLENLNSKETRPLRRFLARIENGCGQPRNGASAGEENEHSVK